MITVLFDLDDTLADLINPWLSVYNERFNDNLVKSDITDWDIRKFIKVEARTKIFGIINEEGFYSKVQPNPIFVEMARDMVKLGDNVGICTSCNNNPTMISEKLKWIKTHVPFINRDNIMFVNDKSLARADLLVDDRVENIEGFLYRNPSSRGYLVLQPHNINSRNRLLTNPILSSNVTFSIEYN